MEGVGSHYRTPVAYQRSSSTPATGGFKRSYCPRAPYKGSYKGRRYVHNISRYIYKKKTKWWRRCILQVYDESLWDVKFDNKGVLRLLNGVELGNRKCDRQLDKIVVKAIKLIENVQLGQEAKDETMIHHVLFFIISDKSPSDTVPTPEKIFVGVGEGNPETWTIDIDQSDKFKMLQKLKFTLRGEHFRHGLETLDKYIPVDVWTDFKDTLLGNVGSIQKGAIYLVAASVSGKECKITLKGRTYFKSV